MVQKDHTAIKTTISHPVQTRWSKSMKLYCISWETNTDTLYTRDSL